MASKQTWFDVDKDGLAKLLAGKSKMHAINELIQNAWDQDVTGVQVELIPIPNRSACTLTVTDDDPNGFSDLSHAFTLFAESEKKSDPTKRGRFNVGEKMVLALCSCASIETTTGTVEFNSDGDRVVSRKCRDAGSVFTGEISMTRQEYEEVCVDVFHLLPPVPTWFNGEIVPPRSTAREFKAQLQTTHSNEHGELRPTKRITVVRLHAVGEGECATLYEMGIPVVSLGDDRWHIDIQQKVPLGLDRDNVPPAYLRTLRAHVANNTNDLLVESDASSLWLRDATEHKIATRDTMNTYLDLGFGKNRVTRDPRDPESTNKAQGQGYQVVEGGSLTAAQWVNVKEHQVIRSSGEVAPTPKPFTPGGKPVDCLPVEMWTQRHRATSTLAEDIAGVVCDREITVKIVRDKAWKFAGACGPCGVLYLSSVHGCFNLESYIEKTLDLLIHELAHLKVGNHLSDKFHEECTRIGAGVALLALEQPELFHGFTQSGMTTEGFEIQEGCDAIR